MVKLRQIAPNFHAVSIGELEIWFSYETAIAFWNEGDATPHVHQNDWGPTTGKHLNYIDRAYGLKKEDRLDYHRFEELLKNATA